MEPARWLLILVVTVFLAEGFALSVFPTQFKQIIAEADPRMLQAAGLVETVLAVGLLAALVMG